MSSFARSFDPSVVTAPSAGSVRRIAARWAALTGAGRQAVRYSKSRGPAGAKTQRSSLEHGTAMRTVMEQAIVLDSALGHLIARACGAHAKEVFLAALAP